MTIDHINKKKPTLITRIKTFLLSDFFLLNPFKVYNTYMIKTVNVQQKIKINYKWYKTLEKSI